MQSFRLVTSISLVLLLTAIGRSETPEPKLPPDGAWARYHLDVLFEDDRLENWKLTARSVGRETVDGRPCRWIEFEILQDASQSPQVHKVLVPEEDLREDADPAGDVLRYIYRDQQGEVAERSTDFVALFGGLFALFPGPLSTAEPVDKARTVEYQDGTLQIPQGLQGTIISSREMRNNVTQTFETKYKVWLHKKVPIGFAYAEFNWSFKRDDEPQQNLNLQFFLEETGTDARSALSEVP